MFQYWKVFGHKHKEFMQNRRPELELEGNMAYTIMQLKCVAYSYVIFPRQEIPVIDEQRHWRYMVQRVHYGGAIGAMNMHTQAKCGCVYEATPFLTYLRELAPPKVVVPIIPLIQLIAVEYLEEYIFVEQMNVSSPKCWRR